MKYHWDEIQRAYDSGKTVRQLQKQFGFARGSWTKAVDSGKIIPRPKIKPLESLNPQSRRSIKNALIRKGRVYECEGCLVSSWMGKPLTLQLDHIDGNHGNMEESNLRFLCPNCHSQTENFCGKNTNKAKTRSLFGNLVTKESHEDPTKHS